MENKIIENSMELDMEAKSINEGLARISVAAFITETDPTIEEMNDIKTAVSEAVTNSIIHGYNEGPGKVHIKCSLLRKIYEKNENVCTIDNLIRIKIKDEGVGIESIEKAKEPLFTTKPDMERSGMGFMFMEMFMDKVDVESKLGEGTTVTMEKKIKKLLKQA